MIVWLRSGYTPDQLDEVVKRITDAGCRPDISKGEEATVVGLSYGVEPVVLLEPRRDLVSLIDAPGSRPLLVELLQADDFRSLSRDHARDVGGVDRGSDVTEDNLVDLGRWDSGTLHCLDRGRPAEFYGRDGGQVGAHLGVGRARSAQNEHLLRHDAIPSRPRAAGVPRRPTQGPPA